jgi:hypothetical protein
VGGSDMVRDAAADLLDLAIAVPNDAAMPLDAAAPVDGAVPICNPPVGVTQGACHGCAWRQGRVFCWGANTFGALGNGTTTSSTVAVPVSDLTDVVQVSTGCGNEAIEGHSCALTGGGEVWCWGSNAAGQLGDQTFTDSSVPVRVRGLPKITGISLGVAHTMAVAADGRVFCWGDDSDAQCGCTGGNCAAPSAVAGVTDAVEVSAGYWHTCVRRAGGTLLCWGRNAYGEVGNRTTNGQITPTSVLGISNAVQIAAGPIHTCARLSDGTAWCWGGGMYGEIGNGMSPTSQLTPAQVSLSFSAAELSTTVTDCARDSAGNVACWGPNVPMGSATPVAVGISDAIGLGGMCAARPSGRVSCWGFNGRGELGDGTMIDRSAPVDVQMLAWPAPSCVGPDMALPDLASRPADLAVANPDLAPSNADMAGAPGAPTSIVAVAQPGGAIALSWSAPGGSVTGYAIDSWPPTVPGMSATTSFTTGALTIGETYLFSIRALAVSGYGPAAYSAPVVAGDVPGPPGDVYAIATASHGTAYWTPANDNAYPVLSYKVVANPGGASVVTSGSATSGSVVVAAGTKYTLSVIATNALGDGPAAVSNAFTGICYANIYQLYAVDTCSVQYGTPPMTVAETTMEATRDPRTNNVDLRGWAKFSLASLKPWSRIDGVGLYLNAQQVNGGTAAPMIEVWYSQDDGWSSASIPTAVDIDPTTLVAGPYDAGSVGWQQFDPDVTLHDFSADIADGYLTLGIRNATADYSYNLYAGVGDPTTTPYVFLSVCE